MYSYRWLKTSLNIPIGVGELKVPLKAIEGVDQWLTTFPSKGYRINHWFKSIYVGLIYSYMYTRELERFISHWKV